MSEEHKKEQEQPKDETTDQVHKQERSKDETTDQEHKPEQSKDETTNREHKPEQSKDETTNQEHKPEQSKDETTDQEKTSVGGPIDPDTGEIDWDCPCLGGMTNGPCGEQFKAAFSCFVYSTVEPKGSDCLEAFKEMQSCFRTYPEFYGEELEDDEEKE
ncbi:7208_t:CDS:2 [Ambispora gerdemannii]|uniref:Mitochondrial intermembrane space import and assembly protein 40 n=1 Tax=Ambispora gerdemannii TaxID=144530 RepID=A0A9N8V828_9GLOM|nr:7208_t:CDS:2 [Ambispora gerdemannii]